MFTIDLEKELLRSKMGSTSKEEDIILTEADKLLKHTTQDDIKILNDLGLNHSLEKSKMIKSKLSFPWERVFHTDEIKSLCVTYGLRFLDINKFKGEIDPLLPTRVKEFQALYEETTKDLSGLDKHAMNMYEEFGYHRFKICAPKEDVELKVVVLIPNF